MAPQPPFSPQSRCTIYRLLPLVFALLSFGQSADAAQQVWRNTATNTNFNASASWNGGAGPAPSIGDVAAFTAAAVAQPTLSSSLSISGLYFSGTGTNGYAITRTSPAAFTLTGYATSIGAETGDANAVAIGAENTSGTNSIAVPITLAPASASTSTFFQAAGGQLTLTSTTAISGSGILLNLTGAGTFSLAGASTYSGGTKIAGPTVINAGTGAILGTGPLELSSGTYRSSGTTTRSLANIVSITGDFTFDSVSTGINEFTGGGSTTGNRTLTVNSVTTRFVTNPFTLGGNLTTAGTGRLNFQAGLNLGGADRTITAGATGAGGNQINGAVDSSASGNKLVLAGNNFTMSGITPGATNVVNFEVNATGTITFTGTNTYTGTTTITAGTLNAASNGALGSGTTGTSSIAVNNGGTLLLNNSTATDRVRNDAPITLGSATGLGTATIQRSSGGTEGLNNTVGLGALTLAASASLNYGGAAVGNGTLTFASFTPAGFTLSITSYNGVFGTTTQGVDGTNDRLIFNATQASNLARFSFVNPDGLTGTFAADQISLGGGFFEIVPVPEPSTWIGGALAVGALGWSQRRRFRKRGMRIADCGTSAS